MAELGSVLAAEARDARAFCRRAWWVFLIGGIASTVFGLFAFFRPGTALFLLGVWFAVYLLVDGVANIYGAVTNRDKDGWWAVLLLGVLAVLVGGFLLLFPPASMVALAYILAFVAVAFGLMLLSLGWKVRKVVSTEWILYLTGALSLLLGLWALAQPVVGGLAVVYIVATWALLIGVLKIMVAFKVKGFADRAGERLHEAAADLRTGEH